MIESVGELVRRLENDYVRGNTQISKHVNFSQHETLERVDAYLNSKHISGQQDSLNRDKPFFNISTAAVNIWYRATDIDRKHIQIHATKSKDWLDSFLATIHLRDWMRREHFGTFLNQWGRTLARYGSGVVKFVQNDSGLHIQVVPWNRLIVDPVDFDANPKIEILELTEAQLRQRVQTHGYDEAQVEALCTALTTRETMDKNRKDNKSDYIKLYELHGMLSKDKITKQEADAKTYVQQMHVISFVGIRKGRKTEYQDFTLFFGEEDKDPYIITHLIKEEGRTLSIGAVEHLFEAQWMTNHSMKAIKDTLDLASKLFFQTADPKFVGMNVISEIENGDILVHTTNMPLAKVETSKLEITSWQNYAVQWKSLGNEITGISEAMLGAQPKSGTAWRQTEALLQESYSLFEVMTENKALHIEDMIRNRILPYLKTKMDTTEEVTATLDQFEIDKIDRIYIKNKSISLNNKDIKDSLIAGTPPTLEDQALGIQQNQQGLREGLSSMGGQRFFKPSNLTDKTWKEQFKDLEWEVEVNITGESFDAANALTTLNTALKLIVTPGFEQNKKAQMVVGRILELTGTMSPIEYNSLPAAPTPSPETSIGGSNVGVLPELTES